MWEKSVDSALSYNLQETHPPLTKQDSSFETVGGLNFSSQNMSP